MRGGGRHLNEDALRAGGRSNQRMKGNNREGREGGAMQRINRVADKRGRSIRRLKRRRRPRLCHRRVAKTSVMCIITINYSFFTSVPSTQHQEQGGELCSACTCHSESHKKVWREDVEASSTAEHGTVWDIIYFLLILFIYLTFKQSVNLYMKRRTKRF